MASSSFRIAFEGEAFKGGEIDVNDLAPALLALGDVVQAANHTLNGNRANASLKLRATADGCFEALLSIDVTMVTAIADMLDTVAENKDRVVAADQLLDLLIKGGIIVGGFGGTVMSLFAAIKVFRGKKPEKAEDRGDGTTSITVNQTNIVVDNRTVNLLEDKATREALEAFGKRALGVRGVAEIRIGERGSENDLSLKTDDLPSFKVPEVTDAEPKVDTSERTAWLKIVTPQFRDGYKWRFTDGGEKAFTATMEDYDFLKQTTLGKELSANDTLRCKIVEEQTLTSSGLTKETKIIEVIEHIQGAKQLPLI